MPPECRRALPARGRRTSSRHNERLAMTPSEGRGDAIVSDVPGGGILAKNSSFRRKPESRKAAQSLRFWTPACAGVTGIKLSLTLCLPARQAGASPGSTSIK
jgi:hypothetical protein